jgi:hypothetical protein
MPTSNITIGNIESGATGSISITPITGTTTVSTYTALFAVDHVMVPAGKTGTFRVFSSVYSVSSSDSSVATVAKSSDGLSVVVTGVSAGIAIITAKMLSYHDVEQSWPFSAITVLVVASDTTPYGGNHYLLNITNANTTEETNMRVQGTVINSDATDVQSIRFKDSLGIYHSADSFIPNGVSSVCWQKTSLVTFSNITPMLAGCNVENIQLRSFSSSLYNIRAAQNSSSDAVSYFNNVGDYALAQIGGSVNGTASLWNRPTAWVVLQLRSTNSNDCFAIPKIDGIDPYAMSVPAYDGSNNFVSVWKNKSDYILSYKPDSLWIGANVSQSVRGRTNGASDIIPIDWYTNMSDFYGKVNLYYIINKDGNISSTQPFEPTSAAQGMYMTSLVYSSSTISGIEGDHFWCYYSLIEGSLSSCKINCKLIGSDYSPESGRYLYYYSADLSASPAAGFSASIGSTSRETQTSDTGIFPKVLDATIYQALIQVNQKSYYYSESRSWSKGIAITYDDTNSTITITNHTAVKIRVQICYAYTNEALEEKHLYNAYSFNDSVNGIDANSSWTINSNMDGYMLMLVLGWYTAGGTSIIGHSDLTPGSDTYLVDAGNISPYRYYMLQMNRDHSSITGFDVLSKYFKW